MGGKLGKVTTVGPMSCFSCHIVMHSVDETYCYRWSGAVRVSVSVCVKHTDELIKMPFGWQTRVSHVSLY